MRRKSKLHNVVEMNRSRGTKNAVQLLNQIEIAELEVRCNFVFAREPFRIIDDLRTSAPLLFSLAGWPAGWLAGWLVPAYLCCIRACAAFCLRATV